MKINLQTVENLVFKDPKVKKLLWKGYANYFKEYLFLKQIGIDHSLISKLYIRFLSNFKNKIEQDKLIKIIGKDDLTFDFSQNQPFFDIILDFSKIVENFSTSNKLEITSNKLRLNMIKQELTNNKLELTNIDMIKQEQINNNYYLITNPSSSGITNIKLVLLVGNFSEKKHEKNAKIFDIKNSCLNQVEDFTNINKIYPNFILSRSKNNAKVTFWK